MGSVRSWSFRKVQDLVVFIQHTFTEAFRVLFFRAWF